MGVAKKKPVSGTKGKNPLRVVKKEDPVDTSLLSKSGKPENQMSSLEKMQMIDKGISKSALVSLKENANLDYEELSKILSVTRATLINKKEKEKFNSSVSEKILALADIYSYGYEVFGDQKKFNEWIFRPNTALAGKSPFEYLGNSFGREEVRNLIGRINYGVYS